MEKFKRISEAHSILSDDNLRARYDSELQYPGFGGARATHSPYGGFTAHDATIHRSRRPLGYFLDGIFRPKNMFWGLAVGICTVGVVKSYLNSDKQKGEYDAHHGNKEMVEAWYNPQTKRYEQPAPWDELYRSMRPKHIMVSRSEVFRRNK